MVRKKLLTFICVLQCMHGLIFVVSDIIRKNSFNGSLSTTVDTSGSHKVTELCTAAGIMSVFMTLKLHELRPHIWLLSH